MKNFKTSNSKYSHQETESSNDFIKLSLGIFIGFGLILSYLPQFIKIIKEKSSFGLSKLYDIYFGVSTN